MHVFLAIRHPVLFLALFWLMVGTALAQQPSTANQIQSLSSRVFTEVQTNIQCTAIVIELQAKIKDLEAQLEAKKDK